MAVGTHSVAAGGASRRRVEGGGSVVVVGERFAVVASRVDMGWAVGRNSAGLQGANSQRLYAYSLAAKPV